MKVKGKKIIVTGAASGMGRELSLQLLQKGAKIVAVDLNEKGLAETVSLAEQLGGQMESYLLNIAERHSVEAFAQQLLEKEKHIDGLINNAGIIQPFVPVNELDYDTIERVMKVNFYGTLYMTKVFLPHLLSRPEAHLLNVASMGAFIPFPGQSLYGASKAAVKLMTEGLYAELQNTSVQVTLAMPGAVNTNISANSGLKVKAEQSAGNMKILAASKAAAIMIDAMENNKFRVLVGKDAKFLDIFSRLMPTQSIRFIVKKMQGLKL